MIVTSMLSVILRFYEVFFASLPLCACQSDANGSIFYDHVKYVILLVKIKMLFK